jgi:hypothetical protein
VAQAVANDCSSCRFESAAHTADFVEFEDR